MARRLLRERGDLRNRMDLASELADQGHDAGQVGRRGHEDVPQPSTLARDAGGDLVGRAVARLAADLHLIVPLTVDLAVAVHLALGVAVDTSQASLPMHVGLLARVVVAVQEVLLPEEGRPPLGRRFHHAAEIHGRPRAAVVTGRALGDRNSLGDRVREGTALLGF